MATDMEFREWTDGNGNSVLFYRAKPVCVSVLDCIFNTPQSGDERVEKRVARFVKENGYDENSDPKPQYIRDETKMAWLVTQIGANIRHPLLMWCGLDKTGCPVMVQSVTEPQPSDRIFVVLDVFFKRAGASKFENQLRITREKVMTQLINLLPAKGYANEAAAIEGTLGSLRDAFIGKECRSADDCDNRFMDYIADMETCLRDVIRARMQTSDPNTAILNRLWSDDDGYAGEPMPEHETENGQMFFLDIPQMDGVTIRVSPLPIRLKELVIPHDFRSEVSADDPIWVCEITPPSEPNTFCLIGAGTLMKMKEVALTHIALQVNKVVSAVKGWTLEEND